MVVVRDYKLGGLYYTLLIAIFVYIIWNMISTGSYLDKSPPISGIVKTSAQLPDNLPVPEYCTPGPFNRNGCIFWSADQIVYPLTGDSNGIFITTRVSISTSYPDAQCNFTTPTNSQCKLGKFEDKQVFYVANVEDITIRVDHAVVTQSSMGFGNNNLRTVASLNMNGRLLKGCSGDKDQYLLTFNEDYRKNANKTYGTMLDVFRFDQLMSAGHCSKSAFSFAKVSEADGSKPGESMRSAGFVVSVPIVYLNRQSAQNLEEITYNYVPAKIEGLEMKVSELRYNPDGSVTKFDRHGVQVIFTQTGSIGFFNLLALILNLVAALALIKVATTIVDLLMVYIMPRRAEYQDAKYTETEFFNEKSDYKVSATPAHVDSPESKSPPEAPEAQLKISATNYPGDPPMQVYSQPSYSPEAQSRTNYPTAPQMQQTGYNQPNYYGNANYGNNYGQYQQ